MVHAKTPDKVRLYHRPTCSKSRGMKKILDEAGIDYEEILYMETPPSYDELKVIAKVLDDPVGHMMRDKEAREEGWDGDANASEEKVLKFISEHPAALQRPIVVRGDRAVIARPPEKANPLLGLPDKSTEASQSGNKPESERTAASGENPPPRQFGR